MREYVRMVQQTRVIVTDDLDGTEEGVRSYRFAWQDAVYEIDLNDTHRDELLRALQPYIDAGRRQGKKPAAARRGSSTGEDLAAVRTWARANGHEVSDRGRVPNAIIEAYRNR